MYNYICILYIHVLNLQQQKTYGVGASITQKRKSNNSIKQKLHV